MDPISLFGIQFTVNLILLSLLARWYVAPKLKNLPLQSALIPLVWIHAFRIIGLTILTPGAVSSSVPIAFREMVAYGDLAAALLALGSILLLRKGARIAILTVWIFNTVGVLDLINATVQGMRHDVFSQPLGINWLVVTFYVPALWISSIMIFYLLLTRRQRSE